MRQDNDMCLARIDYGRVYVGPLLLFARKMLISNAYTHILALNVRI